LAIAMAVSLLFLNLSRGAVVDGTEDPVYQAGVVAFWDQLFGNLTNLQSTLLVLSLIIATAAYLAGPHHWAVSFRNSVRSRIAGWRSSERAVAVESDSLGTFLSDHLSGVRLFGVVVALLTMFIWPRFTVGIVLITLIGLIIYRGLVKVARGPRLGEEDAMVDLSDVPSGETEEEKPTVDQLDRSNVEETT
jgi:hypothetical protein